MRRFLSALAVTIATTASAQIVADPNPPNRFVCVDKSDAYRLALADINGSLEAVAEKFAKEGRCRFMPAAYLFTLDPYLDSDGTPTRVIELTAYGERVWGIMGKFPDGVWLI